MSGALHAAPRHARQELEREVEQLDRIAGPLGVDELAPVDNDEGWLSTSGTHDAWEAVVRAARRRAHGLIERERAA